MRPSTDGRYLLLVLRRRWNEYGRGGSPQPRAAYETWPVDIPARRLVGMAPSFAHLGGWIRWLRGQQRYLMLNEHGDVVVVDTAFRLVGTAAYKAGLFDISPDERYLVGKGSGIYMALWDIQTWQKVCQYTYARADVSDFSPSGQYIMVFGDRSVVVYRAMVPTGVEGEQEQGVRVYPVPGQETLRVAGLAAGTPARVEIADELGRSQLLFEGVAPSAELSLPVASLAAGAYQVHVHSGGRALALPYLKGEP